MTDIAYRLERASDGFQVSPDDGKLMHEAMLEINLLRKENRKLRYVNEKLKDRLYLNKLPSKVEGEDEL